nr:M14 family zinc carboxypeptidase [Candidatus Acidoferrales bacterium]
MKRVLVILALILPAVICFGGGKRPSPRDIGPVHAESISDPFANGWMLVDTNDDGIADAVVGKIIVPDHSSAAENSAAANFAARVGYGSTGLTLPIVITASEDRGTEVPRIWIGKADANAMGAQIYSLATSLQKGQGGIFVSGGNLAVVGADDSGLEAAADAYSARAPYQWKIPGDKFSGIPDAVNTVGHGSGSLLQGLIYAHGEQGILRAIVRAEFPVTATDLAKVFDGGHLAAVREIVVMRGGASVTATNPKPLPAAPPAANAATVSAADISVVGATADSGAPGSAAGEAGAAGGAAAAMPATKLDLATLYTSRGLFTGSARMPVPSASDAHLYISAGESGIAMANFAARMGLEATGITLPIASPAAEANARQVRAQAVVAGDSAIAQEAERKLRAGDTVAAQSETTLEAGVGEIRAVDEAFGRRGAILVRGDDGGAAAALQLLAGHFPNIWETGKQHASLEEIRYDLHRFFSLRSGAGQAAAALYHLDQWMKEINSGNSATASKISDVKAEVFVELADPRLAAFLREHIQHGLNVPSVEVKTDSLHAGTKCCDKDPNLHFEQAGFPFHQGTPTFSEDFVIPWEGNRLLDAVKKVASQVKPNQSVRVVARVSEGPEERRSLQTQIEDIFVKSGADRAQTHVEILCAFKQGYSWLMDEIAPALKGKSVGSVEIDFAKDVDPTGERAMFSPARWVQELYPVDEMLAKVLNVPLEKITLNEFDAPVGGPTYRVRAIGGDGKEILRREFKVTTDMQPYNGVMKTYEQVEVETGWVKLEAGTRTILNQRIKTDIEEYWDKYQNVVLPKVYHFVMAQAHGDLRQEFAPPFDTLKLDIHLSEPDYSLGLDKERISTLEAIQEDTFYSTDTFVNMMGDLETGRPINYIGRVIPIVHASEDGKDGRVHVEFYGKAAANPVVRLSWTDAHGKHQERERNIPVLGGDMMPRLIQARVRHGENSIESLTWTLPADFMQDKYDEWLKVDGQDQVDRSIFSVEQAESEIHWLSQMHAAGLYADELAYPHLKQMAMEFELPPALTAKENAPAERAYASWTVPSPKTPRPMITDYAGKNKGTPIVQWDEPISPQENAEILARLSTFPGVSVYWMGRSYLGQNLWAADVMLPSPSALRSWAKESTLKASIIYSGRQHANEVSSTSHIDKLGEDLVTDSTARELLKQVNVILHPIDNTDGAQLSVDLAKITPDNLLHPGYHGSLSADVSAGQTETDPVYPESRTRKRLIDAWLPDAFLNPHGYPSHEWIQPFSEYSGWVQNRESANSGRAWWIPRGWFTSLGYLRDSEHPYSMKISYALRDQIVEAERNVPGLLPLETRMNDRYERFGQRWQPRDMFQPIVNGIRIYMSLKGTAGRGGAAAAGGAPGGAAAPGSGGVGGLSPDITWDAGYTEAPDETAHGDYMKLLASAGLAFDYVHLKYLAQGKLRITRTEREVPGGVQWRVERARPILPNGTEPEKSASPDR